MKANTTPVKPRRQPILDIIESRASILPQDINAAAISGLAESYLPDCDLWGLAALLQRRSPERTPAESPRRQTIPFPAT